LVLSLLRRNRYGCVMTKMRTVAKVVVGFATLAFALSGCIKMDMDMNVKNNGKIDGSAVIAFSSQLLEMSGQKKSEMIASIKKDWKDLPKGAKAEIYDKDGYIGQKLVFKDMAAEDFAKATESTGSSNPTGGGDDLVLVKVGNTWKFSGTMDMKGELTGGAGTSGDMSKLMKGLKIKIKMTFPGKITKHDKDGKVKDKSITWEPQAGQKVVMLAIANAS
jgi:hypothetical protein